MIVKQSFFRRKLRSLLLLLFSKLENNNNTNFATNGEKLFIDNLFEYLHRRNQDKAVLFDIGANIGEYSQMLLKKSAQINSEVAIHLFEPTQSCFDILQKKFAHSAKVILNKKAVSSSFGTAEIYYDAPKSGLASLHKRNLDAYSIQMNQSELVETIRLDNYIDEKNS